MKQFNKHILEAVNKGILIALDDYEDTEEINSIAPVKNVIRNENRVKSLLGKHEHFVDLGLPSGTLWCKYNLDSPISHITNAAEREKHFHDVLDAHEYIGGFYAWGEIKEKGEFTKRNYIFTSFEDDGDINNRTLGHLTKYTKVDGEILELQDDAAFMSHQYPFKISIPTKEQFEELKNNTECEYKSSYRDIEGLSGIKLTSNINGKHIFFPLLRIKNGGVRHYDSAFDGTEFGYWSSTNIVSGSENDTAFAYCIPKTHWYGSQYTYTVYIQPQLRWYGMQIRPVTMEK